MVPPNFININNNNNNEQKNEHKIERNSFLNFQEGPSVHWLRVCSYAVCLYLRLMQKKMEWEAYNTSNWNQSNFSHQFSKENHQHTTINIGMKTIVTFLLWIKQKFLETNIFN